MTTAEGRSIAAVADDNVVGFDVETVEAWLRTVSDVKTPLQWSPLPGGHSNLTYSLRQAGGRDLVIRRPPQGDLLPKAHDMWREYRIIEALWPTDVPVPKPIAYCDDREVADAHFYVMEKCDGQALFGQSSTASWLDMAARHQAGNAMADALAALHAVDPAVVGLADLSRPDGYLARQLNTWYSSWQAQAANAQIDNPRVHDVHDLLSSRIPADPIPRVVHGDCGPHNALFLQSGDISALLDWEIATLGDPLADLAYTINAWVGPGDEAVDLLNPATAIPGFPRRGEVLKRYVALTRADVSNLAYYRAFNYWKRACIVQGVYARYRIGQKSSEGVDMAYLASRIDRALDAAARIGKEAL
jgi:aminoglycoside phosphotransferase (APT) family kinase protein